tara:strand:- start:1755 stop:2255 length:501 start_codon:yes stop_codon:yes gene_type:complete
MKKISLSFLLQKKEINELLSMHKELLPKDPLLKFSKYKKLLFYYLCFKYCDIYDISTEKIIKGIAIILPLSHFFYLFISLFFNRYIFKKNKLKKKKRFGILLYIYTNKEFQGSGIGTSLINNYVSRDYKNIFFITIEKTYKNFYFKLKTKSFKLLGRRLCYLSLVS